MSNIIPPAQASDEPMRAAFFAWFAEHGSGHQYKEAQDAFCAGYQAATPRATVDVERVALEFAEQLVRMHGYIDFHLQFDHACSECKPDGQSVKPGFQCSYHRAKSYIAATKGAKP
jgi:hypothetical protein